MRKIIYLILCVAMAGCADPSHDFLRNSIGSYKNYYNIKGKINNGAYHSPNDVFSVGLIGLNGPGIVVSDTFRKDFGKHQDYSYNVGTVSFQDDFGTFYRLDVFEIPNEVFQMKQPVEATLLDITMEYELNLYKELDPKVKIVHKDDLTIDQQKIRYFIAYMANGSTYFVNGSRVDVLRSSLAFVKNNYTYVISNQSGKTNINDETINAIKEQLVRIFKTMSFNDGQ